MILKVYDLEKIYKGKVSFRALENINMEMAEGEFVAIMGPSGSGKSTFLNTISTIDKPTGGSVVIAGVDPHKMNDEELSTFRRQELGFVFQQFNLINTLTVGENIILPLTLDHVPLKLMDKKLKEISEFLGIGHILDKRTYEISGGQAQRVAIARAVINEPSILLADEPTGNLDSKAAKDVMKLFKKLNDSMNVSIIMVTHDPNIAAYSDKTYIIKDGKIYQEIINRGEEKLYRREILNTMSLLGGDEIDDI
ncbi:ABC transporter ATP-binding protein [Streptococcus agalactiae]|uniref:ABC transporter ATP-binding protein n=1 Tax=Streptococcus agalactiae TaxID=1311 RepID=UPI000A35A27E|nr:ABC transporter ATP-binding protein [Streptococcus agalactiae]OTG44334.1 bacitracin ABC transporter ATP-binding protein [Streptococcus agalactiae]OTG50706.1 bacitracin ABC transporter ATP-binding protein [Streptococcus agalactiae]OTG55596.1 bacitracin ABC transporter ATP-binding protein [Streptococcus agalactiae]RRA75880.1 ABC transporter ATP-binding protein [Streptococcus agalactiae]RRA84761.1 ABC transporter ATP-binding protein [Streptococcus agalactiae]